MPNEVIARKISMVDVDLLQPHPENPRRGDVEAIEASIDANGFYRPIIARTENSMILAGHGSWMAAKRRGIAKVPVVWVDVDEATAKRILLADNRTNDLATYDDSALVALLSTIAEESTLDGTGFDDSALDLLRTRVETERVRADAAANGDPARAVSADAAANVARSIVLDCSGAEAVRFDDLITVLRGDAVDTPAVSIVLDALERAAGLPDGS